MKDFFCKCDQIRRESLMGIKKKCSENMQQIYRRTPMPKWDLDKVALQIY